MISVRVLLLLLFPASLLAHVPQIPLAYRHIFGGGGGMYMESMYLPPVTTGPWSPSWSPDGTEIVFAMQGSLWRIGAEGGEAAQLTSGPHYDNSPDWSRDGKRIAFTRDTGKVIDIWTVAADGGEPEKLTRSVAFSVNPRWSPDGAAILFDSIDNAERIGLWTISASDGTVRPLVVDSFQNITGSFSPDGRDIVFVSDRQWDGRRIQGTGGIWRLRLGQNEPTILLPEETVWHARPVWSPDGRKVAYGSFRSGRIQLWVMSAGDTNPMQITYDEGEIFTPAWSPDSRKLAYISNAGGKFSLRVVAAVGGTPKDVEVSRRKYRYPVGRVEVTVKDAGTGEATEARVYLKASDGKSYTPPGEFHRMVVVTDDHYFHTRGSFTIELPAGPASIEVLKGFEYGPKSQTVNVVAGETQKVELTLSRMSDLASLGWYSGDNHLHMNYGGIFQATPRSLLLEADGEDLNVVNDLVANQAGTRIHDLAFFEGKLSSSSKPNRLLYFNEEYRPSFAGHMSLLNVKKFVHPQFDGFAGTALAAHYPSNAQILDEVHAQGAVAGYVHPFQTPGRDPEDDDYRGAREFPVSAALGQVDYYDVMCIWSDERVSANVWYRVLNLGFRVPASAGTDAMTNYWRAPAIGTTRVYVKAGSPLDYGNWIRGLTEGRSFVTNGPLLFVKVEGLEPGAELRLPGGGETKVSVEVEATSILPMENLDILVNGEVVSSTKATDPHRVELRTSIPVKKSGWIAARVTGPERLHLLMDSYVYAHTSPIYLIKGNESPSSPSDARYFLKWIDRVLVLLQESEAFDTKAQKEEVIEVWRRGREVYSVLAQE